MSRGTIAYIDQQALQQNLQRVKQLAPNTAILAMIKSNGYGHGLNTVAAQFKNANALGVACLEEAMQLRESGITTPLVVMSGFIDQEELHLFHRYQLTSIIHQSHQLDLLEKFKQQIPVWLKVDSGMNRLGFSLQEFENNYRRICNISQVARKIGIMTHLATADSETAFAREQIHRFLQATKSIALPKSIANSSAILNFPESHVNWVRPGILLYGVSPLANENAQKYGLKPVMTLKAKLIAVKKINRGDSVGYGATWQSPEDNLPIGVAAIGYGDGYPRHAISGTPTLIHKQVCPLVGRVSMDMICVDLRNAPQATVGSEVTLWGEGLPVETVARFADTVAYELLCGVTSRVKFVMRNNV